MSIARLKLDVNLYSSRKCTHKLVEQAISGTLVQDCGGLMNSANGKVIKDPYYTDCLILEGPHKGKWTYLSINHLNYISALEALAMVAE
jgi:hypothetical protein